MIYNEQNDKQCSPVNFIQEHHVFVSHNKLLLSTKFAMSQKHLFVSAKQIMRSF